MRQPAAADALSSPRTVSRRYWLERLPALADGRSRLRPDVPRAPSGEMRSEPATVPADVRDFVTATSGGNSLLELCVWASGLCFLLYRLDPSRTVVFATPAPRADGRGSRVFVHGIHEVGRQSFRQLLECCRTRLLQDYDHGAISFPALLSDLALPAVGHDLFDVVLMSGRLHDAPESHGQDANLLIEPGDGTVVCQFDAGRYGHDTWRARLSQLWEAMRACQRQPDSRLCRLDVLGPVETERILVDWNRTAAPISDLCVDQLVARQAVRAPDAEAVGDGDGTAGLGYSELTAAAARLARRLRSANAGSESRVGLFGTRSPQLLVAMLGTWGAGAAFVPLDAAAPAERTLRTVQAAGLAAVVSLDGTATSPPGFSGPVIAVDSPVGDELSDIPSGERHPDQLAYVMYTSGSTGTPKGVMVSHRSLANYLQWAVHAYGLGPNGRVLVATSFAYDLTLTSLLAPLLAGGTVVVSRGSDDIDALGEAARSGHRPLAMLKLTPSHLSALGEAGSSAELAPSASCLVVGGEALRDAHLRRWRAAAGRGVVFNEYGPTEATVGATVHRSTGPSPDETVPIGRPIANTRVYLLDRDLLPVPDRIPGEVYIAGVGVARGYAGQPGDTAAAFLPDPFSAAGGGRMYRTGDIARRREDGELEFLGRCDRQVKLSGVRVELGEIEAALVDLPAVRAAAVQLGRDRRGRVAPMAYVVPDGDLPPLRALRRALRDRLPEGSVPSSFIAVDQLPLTAGGKIAYDLLPKPRAPAPRSPSAGNGALTEREATLVALWEDVLGVPVGRDDDFFELGGDSILAIRVVAQARERGLVIEPSQVFELGTVSRLAEAAEVDHAGGPPIQVTEGPVPLTPIQCWFFAANPYGLDHYSQVRSFELIERVGARRMAQALGVVVERHDALRSAFTRTASGWTQAAGDVGGDSLLTIVDLRAASPPERDAAWELACGRAVQSVNTKTGLLLQAVLGDGQEPGQRLGIAIHHLAVDQVSWITLLADLERALAGRQDGLRPAPSFLAWSADQPRRARSPEVEGSAAFWLMQLATLGARDGTADVGIEADSERLVVRLSPGETHRLFEGAYRAYNAQAVDVLSAALAAAYASWAGESGLCIALESNGRASAGPWSTAVGWFTALYPVALPTAPDPGAALTAAKDRLRAVPGDGSSFGLLRYLHPTWSARLSRSPEPPVSLNYLGRLDPEPTAGGVLRPLPQTSLLARAPAARRGHRLEVTALMVGGELLAEFCWNRRHDGEAAVRALADQFSDELRKLARHCVEQGGPGVTPSDFPHVDLETQELEVVLRQVTKKPVIDEPR